MDPSKITVPALKDLTIDNITENVIAINSQNPNPRFKYILERLVVHLHDLAREARLSTQEWMAGIQFLTSTGQICTDVRQVGWKLYLPQEVPQLHTILNEDNLTGIHSPLRYPGLITISGQHRPSKTTQQYRRHCSRSFPHPRSRRHVTR